MLQSDSYLKRIKGAAMAKVKISDVAREAGVSLGTVSNALNHPEKLRPETLKLINETINRLGYLPNQSARQLAGGATKSFGLVLPRLDHGFSLQIASGAHNEARKHGYDLLIANADNDDILEDHYLRYFMGTQMSGVMVQPMASPDWHPAMTKMPVPIVHLDIHCSEPGYYVAADNEAQGRIIAELAIARGAHHIVVVGRAAFMQLTLRVLGIHKALALHPDIKIEVIDAGIYVVIVCFFLLAACENINRWSPTGASYLFFGIALFLGIGFGTMFPAFNTLFVNLAPNSQRGTATSTYLTSWDVGIGLGMVAGGYIAHVSSFQYAYLFGALLTVLSMFYFRIKVTPHFNRNKVR